MSELGQLDEAVLGERLLPDSFQRAMLPKPTATDTKQADRPGKPATRYRRG